MKLGEKFNGEEQRWTAAGSTWVASVPAHGPGTERAPQESHSPTCQGQACAPQKPQFLLSKMEVTEMTLPPPSLVQLGPNLQHLESAMCPLEVACGVEPPVTFKVLLVIQFGSHVPSSKKDCSALHGYEWYLLGAWSPYFGSLFMPHPCAISSLEP